MRYEKSDEAVGKLLQQTVEGDQEKSLEEKANSQQEEGDEKESALVEEQHGGAPETEIDEGAARRSEREISNQVKELMSATFEPISTFMKKSNIRTKSTNH